MYPFYEIRESDNNYFYTIGSSVNITFPAHLHSYIELIYIVEGSIKVNINESIKDLDEGDIAISFQNDIHSYYTKDFSKSIILLFSPDIIGEFFNNIKEKSLAIYFFPKNTYDDRVMDLIEMLRYEKENGDDENIVRGFLYSIMGCMSSNFIYDDSKQIYDNTIQSILKYTEKHYRENISLDSISKDLGFSKFYISRIFNSKIGYKFNKYINRLRINSAQRLLTNTDMKILNIGLECGFESLRNFNRVFKELVGCTPSEYRSA
ncbi:AraC family transcriptional regulator [Vallitalea longa]|uniref:AraC family transcriptional regulator n=1 Tax=Vallitalea longa TaxID=2936439 RepID=A0A9W6DFR4_9FIRM|nr:AraC family transcriptional regulator [Vallitalea longa]GKX31516.1 AraC family transcriptional regulator [Vallitalea longa]